MPLTILLALLPFSRSLTTPTNTNLLPDKINRIIEAKVAQLPPSTYPAGYHPCTASNCYYANPPRSTAGIFGCLGATEGEFTCTGRYCVSDDQALENRERLEQKLMRKARDARTEVWEEQMRNWFWEFEAMERGRVQAEAREREVARAAARMASARALNCMAACVR